MKKNEFLSKITEELNKNNVADIVDIVSEYEQHFAFKMADGFSEEEIAAKLGNPSVLASQFESNAGEGKCSGRKTITVIGLCFADLFTGMLFVLLLAWGVIMATFALVCAVSAVCLIGGLNIYSLIPPMPYLPAMIFGVAFAALSVLTGVGCVFFAVFVRQLMRSYGRFHHNTIAAASRGAVLPALAVYPQLKAKTRRKIRSIAVSAFVAFAACFVLGIIVSMFFSGAIEFWHAWEWFGYIGSH